MTKPRAVERDNAIFLGKQGYQAADFEILHHRAIAMQEHQRRPFSPFDVVELNAININEFTGCRVFLLGSLRSSSHHQRGYGQSGSRA